MWAPSGAFSLLFIFFQFFYHIRPCFVIRAVCFLHFLWCVHALISIGLNHLNEGFCPRPPGFRRCNISYRFPYPRSCYFKWTTGKCNAPFPVLQWRLRLSRQCPTSYTPLQSACPFYGCILIQTVCIRRSFPRPGAAVYSNRPHMQSCMLRAWQPIPWGRLKAFSLGLRFNAVSSLLLYTSSLQCSSYSSFSIRHKNITSL